MYSKLKNTPFVLKIEALHNIMINNYNWGGLGKGKVVQTIINLIFPIRISSDFLD